MDILRLDRLHPVISGNKWFKLKPYLDKALKEKKQMIITFGGAWSNHLVATAAAARQLSLKSIGIIRGEKPQQLSLTLRDAQDFGMELYFITRTDYRNKILPAALNVYLDNNSAGLIPEGGFGPDGMNGAASIGSLFNHKNYTAVCCAVGTGTMLAGLYLSVYRNIKKITGVSVLKNNFKVAEEVKKILSEQNCFADPAIIHDYHFGGYAKYSDELIGFMNNFYTITGIPSDFVYTGKLFYAVYNMISSNYFPQESKILIIHSGGLQGNRSLKKGTLIF